MTGLADGDVFKICIQVCVCLGFRRLNTKHISCLFKFQIIFGFSFNVLRIIKIPSDDVKLIQNFYKRD